MLLSIPFLTVAISIGSSMATGISANSAQGRELLAAAGADRELQQQDNSFNFLNQYSIKFQGCHHIQQWNANADAGSNVRVMTKRLARFRLCPSDDCSNEKSVGCRSKYGDYIVDMSTFLQSYMQTIAEERDEKCGYAQEMCNNQCGNGNSEDCWSGCYQAFSEYDCQQYAQNQGFQAQQYTECQQFQFNNNYDQTLYYIGPYCADQGGEIRLGVFTDDTCTTFSQNGPDMFYNAMGYALPYSSSSLVSTKCLACSQTNDNGYAQSREVCSNVYQVSGKCETRMNIDYPNESSCNYIEGVKVIRNDGVIRTSSRGKSKAAAVAIGLFTTLSVLLAGYVYYLRTKLSRAQINLSAASDALVS
ncbi:hypothetical protein FisN_8Lh345 [Fistulifera solaris]|uniref:Folate receptor-like domain-containing protein n=1 Tax=Fistulifera solaris TaxID=1519565 RepID=A0A1Z5JN07_FISSO|nr:hypothetical protein FisN_8Lh345 [Fistulifera solaris]|eukprot:GAX15364.1 hypothetical protein FisN_8Lh345 [Fistulifera solaris]